MTKRFTLFSSVRLAGLLALIVGMFGAATLQAQQALPNELTGTVVLKFIDPAPGSEARPEIVPILRTGTTYTSLNLEASVAEMFVSQEVTVTGNFVEGREGAFTVENLERVPGAALVDPLAPVGGNEPFINLLCKQEGFNEPFPAESYGALMDGTEDNPAGGLINYWNDVSYGNYTIDGSEVLEVWLDVPFIGNSISAINDAKELDYFQSCIDAAEDQVDFSQFDGINFIGAENGGAAFAFFDGIVFETEDVTKRFRVTYNPIFAHNVNVLGHEMGHTLLMRHIGAIPFTYTTNRSIMSDGNLGCLGSTRLPEGFTSEVRPDNGCFAGGLDAYQVYAAGWIDEARVTRVGIGEEVTIDLQRLANPGPDGQLIALVDIPGDDDMLTVSFREGGVGPDTPLFFRNDPVVDFQAGVGTEPEYVFESVAISRALIEGDLGRLSLQTDPAIVPQDEEDYEDFLSYVFSPFNQGRSADDAGNTWLPGETYTDFSGISVTVNSFDIAEDGTSSVANVTIRNNAADALASGTLEAQDPYLSDGITGDWQVVQHPDAEGGSYLESSTVGDTLSFNAQSYAALGMFARGPGQGVVCMRVGEGECMNVDLDVAGGFPPPLSFDKKVLSVLTETPLADFDASTADPVTVTFEVVEAPVGIDQIAVGQPPAANGFFRFTGTSFGFTFLYVPQDIPVDEYVLLLNGEEYTRTPSEFIDVAADDCGGTMAVFIAARNMFGQSVFLGNNAYPLAPCRSAIPLGDYTAKTFPDGGFESYFPWGRGFTSGEYLPAGDYVIFGEGRDGGFFTRIFGDVLTLTLQEVAESATLEVTIDGTEFLVSPTNVLGEREVSFPIPQGEEVTLRLRNATEGVTIITGVQITGVSDLTGDGLISLQDAVFATNRIGVDPTQVTEAAPVDVDGDDDIDFDDVTFIINSIPTN